MVMMVLRKTGEETGGKWVRNEERADLEQGFGLATGVLRDWIGLQWWNSRVGWVVQCSAPQTPPSA